jgi:hypothetical protein
MDEECTDSTGGFYRHRMVSTPAIYFIMPI